MNDPFERTQMLLGGDAMDILKNSKVAVFGIGGVGSYAAMALARTGVGSFILVDHDRVSVSNINRQAIAYYSTVGKYKVDVMGDLIMDINPRANVCTYKCFADKDTINDIDLGQSSYIIDAIDTVTSKLVLIERARLLSLPIISCMGAGNKLESNRFKVCDIDDTSVCPLARVMRRELRARGISGVKAVYSDETPLKPASTGEKQTPGSVAYVPSAAGLLLAGAVVDDLTNKGDMKL